MRRPQLHGGHSGANGTWLSANTICVRSSAAVGGECQHLQYISYTMIEMQLPHWATALGCKFVVTTLSAPIFPPFLRMPSRQSCDHTWEPWNSVLKRSYLCKPSQTFLNVAAADVLPNSSHLKKGKETWITCSIAGLSLSPPTQQLDVQTIRPHLHVYFYHANAN